MPIIEPTVLDLRAYALRHIGPKATVWPDAIGASYTVLNRTDMVARPLPQANIPNSVDFASGKWVGRMYDAGEGSITWPNKEASDGVPWRLRFDPTNKLQWLEIWLDEYLEQVLVVTKVTPDRNQVLVEGYDAVQLLKSAYERDWIVQQSPRDVIERGTQLWSNVTSDNFPVGTLNAQWTNNSVTGGTVSTANGGLLCSVTSSVGSTAEIDSAAVTVPSTATWRALCLFQAPQLNSTGAAPNLKITESTGQTYILAVASAGATTVNIQFLQSGQPPWATLIVPTATAYTFMIESDGEWVWAFTNGQFVGGVRRVNAAATTSLTVRLQLLGEGVASNCTFTGVLAEALQPFLMRRGSNTDLGDYVLPGGAATYPYGGLHGRYYNDLALQSDTNRLLKIHHPSYSQAYGGSSNMPEYQNQQDATITTALQNPLPGAATSNWSVVWFGAIYLKLSGGNYTFKITLPAHANNQAVRLWVGQTRFGDQIIDQWNFSNTSAQVYSATLTASTLAGTLSYGGGTVTRDGWYPIKIEYAVDATAATAPTFAFTPTGSYTDPGGTALTGGVSVTVPATSLSTLGCVDNRHQAISHYDLAVKNAIAFGYQIALEPQQLESGSFPGIFAPRLREGHDTDVQVEPDDTQRKEGMVNYASLVDGTDQASSMWGNGAGFQNGNTGQLQGVVFDPVTLQNALFDMQGWQDAADVAYSSLLGQVLGSQLSLRLAPWQTVSGDPTGRQRLAFTWPLPGSVAQFRWRPGDGVRILARDINIQDTFPRQMLEITRNIHPNGVTSTLATFASRPKTGAYALRQTLSAALRPQRNYQRTRATVPTNYCQVVAVPNGQTSGQNSFATLQPGDTIIRAVVRVNYNPSALSFGLVINGTDQTSILNGPWTTVPVLLDVGAVVTANSSNEITVALKNEGGSVGLFSWQLLIDVMR